MSRHFPWCRLIRVAALICLAAARTALAQPAESAPLQAVRLAEGERITLNGRLDDAAWARAPVFDAFVGKEPEPGTRPEHITRVRLMFDAQAVYVGIEALDPQPERIRAPLVRHDGVIRTQDFIAVYIDAVGAKQSAQWFRVNAVGSTADGMHNHADDNENFAPDFDFDAAAARNDQGWTAVMRIPFASLRFPRGQARPWRMMITRRIPREQAVMVSSVLIPRELASVIANLQSVQGLQVPQDDSHLSLRPSLTLRSERASEAGVARNGSHVDASLDIKWRPLPELVVDVALNPDFSQVALDVPQLRGNTLFALELAEKRPFFFESSDLLRAPGGGLYTRSFTEPRAGARATWRGERLAATAFAIDDRGGGLTLLPGPYASGAVLQPASRTAVLRLRGDAEALQWGAQVVQRDYRDARGGNLGHNIVVGPDVSWQPDPAWRIKAQWLGASTSALPAGDALAASDAKRGQRRFASVAYTVDGAEASLSVDDLDRDFRHDSAFVVQTGARTAEAHLGLGWFDVKPLNQLWFNLNAAQTREHGSGTLVQEYVTPSLWMNGTSHFELELQWRGYSVLRSAASARLLHERYLKADLNWNPAPWVPLISTTLSIGRMADLGDFSDPLDDTVREGARLSISPRLRPLPRLELEPQWTRALLRQPGGVAYAESAAQLLAVWHFDARRTLRAIAQRSTLDRSGQRQWADRSLSLTYAWRATSGSVLYVGASRARQPFVPARADEVFVKLQFDVDDLRQDRIRW
jgi:Domain of unknown function (DUF5916)